MVITCLLPTLAVVEARKLLRSHELRFVHSWRELTFVLRDDAAPVLLFDPIVDGRGVDAALKFLRRNPHVTCMAYVTRTPANLKAIFRLARLGLRHVYVRGDSQSEMRLRRALDRLPGEELALNLLGAPGSKLGALPPDVLDAVTDLFARPARYDTAADIARQAGIRLKRVYQEFARAGLMAPKQLLMLAKVIHAYSYFHHGKRPTRRVHELLGYSDPQCLARHIFNVLDCQPNALVNEMDEQEFALRVFEWLDTPHARRTNAERRSVVNTSTKAPQSTKQPRPLL